MKLRFEVDQAEAFRRGVNCPKRVVTIEVDRADHEAAALDAAEEKAARRDLAPKEFEARTGK